MKSLKAGRFLIFKWLVAGIGRACVKASGDLPFMSHACVTDNDSINVAVCCCEDQLNGFALLNVGSMICRFASIWLERITCLALTMIDG